MIELFIYQEEYALEVETSDFELEIDQSALCLEIETVSIVYIGGEPYFGTYKVTPKIKDSVILDTTDKLLKEDVIVQKIPQFEVSNEAGGKTLILGEEYYG